MALFLFTKAILAGEPIKVFNHGKHKRSFTYIDDIVEGVIRTLDKTGNVAEARGEGRGRIAGEEAGEVNTGQGRGGQGGGYGRAADADALAADELSVENWTVYEGTVTQAPAAGVDLVIETESGEEIVAGTGPDFLAQQGFALAAGEKVRMQGFWEDDEFKVAQITRLRDGLTVNLRDQLGRPAWSGAGQRALAGQGGSRVGQGTLNGDGTGTGQAEVDEWVTVEGVATSADTAALVVKADGGQEIVMDGRPWRYLLEQGFQVAAGDGLSLVGFYENGSFEAGEITNLGTGQEVLIRDTTGRPMWAGRGGS
jgi:hypothetical protein